MDKNIWLIVKTSCIVILYRIMTTQHLDTDTVYHLYRTSLIYHHLLFFKGVYMVNLKITIDYNNILITAQMNYIATVSASEAHSKRHVCIKVSERYYRIASNYGQSCINAGSRLVAWVQHAIT